MDVEVLEDAGSVAQRAASIIAEEAWDAIAARGTFTMAVSGGRTPWLMLRDLAAIEHSLIAEELVDAFLAAEFSHGERHVRRLNKSGRT
ncbi:MAG: 6-phosphogluconolactonase [Acidobacteriia bacterium]|nr:6-phosphogluconolactonase [Terriglobia bacterium]